MEEVQIKIECISSCPICGCENLKKWCNGIDRIYKSTNKFVYSKCLNCAVIFQSLRPIEQEVHKVYPMEYAPYQAKLIKDKDRNAFQRFFYSLGIRIVGQTKFQKDISQIYEHIDNTSTVLDFGCGAGKFLNKISKKGCKTIGADFSVDSVNQVRENGHEGYISDDSFFESIGTNQIDVIRMNHVVEHLYNPKDSLSKLRNLLKKDGKIHIAVPNPSGVSAKLFNSYWYGLECPRHIILYAPVNLTDLLIDCGFSNVTVYHEPQSKDMIRSVGYILADFGLIKDSQVENLINSSFLQFVFSVPNRIAKIIRKTDRFHILAVR